MSGDSLREALKKELSSYGQYQHLTAELRTLILNILCRDSIPEAECPPLNENIKLLDALIHEYLTNRGCLHTASILKAECGLDVYSRGQLLEQLKIEDHPQSQNVPTLVRILEYFVKNVRSLKEQDSD